MPADETAFASPRAWLDELGWIPWDEVRSVLCVASGGGQQGPLFASLGLSVTVTDIAPEQLDTDRAVAAERHLSLETVEADMLDLSALYDRQFDLAYQPISSLYAPDVSRLYREVFRTVRDGGYYHVEHWNPVQMQLSEYAPWDGEAYRLVHPQGTGEPLAWSHAVEGDDGEESVSWNYIHTLGALIGAVCAAGFMIRGFGERGHGDAGAEPGTIDHFATYVPSFFSIFAQKPSRA